MKAPYPRLQILSMLSKKKKVRFNRTTPTKKFITRNMSQLCLLLKRIASLRLRSSLNQIKHQCLARNHPPQQLSRPGVSNYQKNKQIPNNHAETSVSLSKCSKLLARMTAIVWAWRARSALMGAFSLMQMQQLNKSHYRQYLKMRINAMRGALQRIRKNKLLQAFCIIYKCSQVKGKKYEGIKSIVVIVSRVAKAKVIRAWGQLCGPVSSQAKQKSIKTSTKTQKRQKPVMGIETQQENQQDNLPPFLRYVTDGTKTPRSLGDSRSTDRKKSHIDSFGNVSAASWLNNSFFNVKFDEVSEAGRTECYCKYSRSYVYGKYEVLSLKNQHKIIEGELDVAREFTNQLQQYITDIFDSEQEMQRLKGEREKLWKDIMQGGQKIKRYKKIIPRLKEDFKKRFESLYENFQKTRG